MEDSTGAEPERERQCIGKLDRASNETRGIILKALFLLFLLLPLPPGYM